MDKEAVDYKSVSEDAELSKSSQSSVSSTDSNSVSKKLKKRISLREKRDSVIIDSCKVFFIKNYI